MPSVENLLAADEIQVYSWQEYSFYVPLISFRILKLLNSYIHDTLHSTKRGSDKLRLDHCVKWLALTAYFLQCEFTERCSSFSFIAIHLRLYPCIYI